MTGIRMLGVDCVGFIIITSSRWISATSVSYGHKRILWPQAYLMATSVSYGHKRINCATSAPIAGQLGKVHYVALIIGTYPVWAKNRWINS
jgi:hypothetical protein